MLVNRKSLLLQKEWTLGIRKWRNVLVILLNVYSMKEITLLLSRGRTKYKIKVQYELPVPMKNAIFQQLTKNQCGNTGKIFTTAKSQSKREGKLLAHTQNQSSKNYIARNVTTGGITLKSLEIINAEPKIKVAGTTINVTPANGGSNQRKCWQSTHAKDHQNNFPPLPSITKHKNDTREKIDHHLILDRYSCMVMR